MRIICCPDRTGQIVSAAQKTLDYVLGYTCCNDMSARGWQISRRAGCVLAIKLALKSK